jgi:hypothetical protein
MINWKALKKGGQTNISQVFAGGRNDIPSLQFTTFPDESQAKKDPAMRLKHSAAWREGRKD